MLSRFMVPGRFCCPTNCILDGKPATATHGHAPTMNLDTSQSSGGRFAFRKNNYRGDASTSLGVVKTDISGDHGNSLSRRSCGTQGSQERFMFYIYGLHLEGDDEIRYVGSTCEPKKRMVQHKAGDSRNPEKDNWATANADRLRMKILQSGVKESDRRKAEQRAILECQGKGHRLLNDRRASRRCATTEDVTWWLDHIEGDKPY